VSSIADQSTRRGESTFVGAEVGLRYHLTPRMVWQMGSTRCRGSPGQRPSRPGWGPTAGRGRSPPPSIPSAASAAARGARERYPKLGEVLTGDVTQLLALLPATNAAIACRISAYWNSTEQFQRLANSVLAFSRERILIDFFDRDLVESGHSIAFNSDGSDAATWRTGMTTSAPAQPRPSIAPGGRRADRPLPRTRGDHPVAGNPLSHRVPARSCVCVSAQWRGSRCPPGPTR